MIIYQNYYDDESSDKKKRFRKEFRGSISSKTLAESEKKIDTFEKWSRECLKAAFANW